MLPPSGLPVYRTFCQVALKLRRLIHIRYLDRQDLQRKTHGKAEKHGKATKDKVKVEGIVFFPASCVFLQPSMHVTVRTTSLLLQTWCF